MNILPYVKSYKKENTHIALKDISWSFNDNADTRIINEARRIFTGSLDGFPVEINAGGSNDEAYELIITPDKITITSEGAPGGFYALQTLKQLMQGGDIPCGTITDYPDMAHRGFYHDITRGRIPTLETLKGLADTLALCKINSLQLYVEHVFEFAQYAPCHQRLGSISEAELREFDSYCHERFIDLIPSLATFGHLYHLLQDCGYKHLCEIPGYTPYEHYWFERMVHHTINPECPESFELISAMIDRYMSVFCSEYFNICGDETFDLGRFANKGKDKGKLYFDYVCKLIKHIQSKGKKVMMWADVMLNHPEYIDKIPDGVIYLNWNYSSRVPESNFSSIAELSVPQLVCPGTSTWNNFAENVEIEEKNIALLADYGYKYNAYGLINTSWGDMGNICSLAMTTYGILCGACVSWDKTTVFDGDFRKLVSRMFYKDAGAVDIVARLSALMHSANWKSIIRFDGLRRVPETSPNYETARQVTIALESERQEPEIYEDAIARCLEAENELAKLKDITKEFYVEILQAIRGTALLVKWNAANRYYKLDCYVDYPSFRETYERLWLAKNKRSELDEVLAVFDRQEELMR